MTSRSLGTKEIPKFSLQNGEFRSIEAACANYVGALWRKACTSLIWLQVVLLYSVGFEVH